jgi:L-alanine-DL-glutamate epimerase-like enolase superfamily enzyme
MRSRCSRRWFLRAAAAFPAPFAIVRAARRSDIRIETVEHRYQDFTYRAPMKFGGNVVDRVTLLDVECTVRSAGKTARGFGSMPLGNVWSFPSRVLPYDATLAAMKELAGRIAAITRDYPESGHPVDINAALEPAYLEAAARTSAALTLAEPVPKLCAMVVASAFDAAIHDAYGKLHGLNCYSTYGPEFMEHDLSRYLGPAHKGEFLDRYVSRAPKPRMPVYHLVGAVDPVEESEIAVRVGDGLPESLAGWIRAGGLTHLKVKLNGDQLDWDIRRVLAVHRVASATGPGVRWFYSLDFNEKCPNADYLVAFLRRVREETPEGFARIQYVEQPTARDLKSHRDQDMHRASALKPVVIDESLTDLESLDLACAMGYTGAALKACKQQSQALLMAAAARRRNMFLCVQDLTCPGASLIHSAGLAAHVDGVAAIEANARQYVPAANRGWDERFPGVFTIRGGIMNTGILRGPGLGAR